MSKRAKIVQFLNKLNYYLKVCISSNLGAKIYKQVGGVLIDQTLKDASTTLSQRVGHINSQIDKTSELIKKIKLSRTLWLRKFKKPKHIIRKWFKPFSKKNDFLLFVIYSYNCRLMDIFYIILLSNHALSFINLVKILVLSIRHIPNKVNKNYIT